MEQNIVTGLSYIFIAGTFSGIFAIPFKKNANWTWENNWFIWSFMALLIVPWVVAFATVPSLIDVVSSNSACLWLVILFGLIWGYGAILFGKGIDYLGVSLGQPIMLGLINSVGTLMPIVLKNPEQLLLPEGIKIMIGIGVIVIGIIYYSIAGSRKEKCALKGSKVSVNRQSFRKGLIICILAGVFGPMINFAFVYGEPMQRYAESQGASAVYAANAVWCIVLSAGFLINILECIRLFRKNSSWKTYNSNKLGILFPMLAGIFWFLSIMFYGMGGNTLGENGSSTGWAIMQSTAVIASCVSGIICGEWKRTNRSIKNTMFVGLLLLVIGIMIIAWKI